MFKAAIITVSDTCAMQGKEDLSGAKIAEILQQDGDFSLVEKCILPDEKPMLIGKFKELCDRATADIIITTGGTGFSQRDITPEATRDVLEKEAPGVAEAIRSYSLQFTSRAMLSRGICGIRKKTIILNLAGSPTAVAESLPYVLPTLKHGLNVLLSRDSNCARIITEKL